MSDSNWPDDWSEPPEDDDLFDPPDDESDVELLPCPQCGADVYEEAQQCPSCGTYITHGTNLWQGRQWWWIALGLIGTLAVILALAFGSL